MEEAINIDMFTGLALQSHGVAVVAADLFREPIVPQGKIFNLICESDMVEYRVEILLMQRLNDMYLYIVKVV